MKLSTERVNTLRAHALMTRLSAEMTLLQRPPHWARSRLGFLLKVGLDATDLYEQFQEMIANRLSVLRARYDKLAARYPKEPHPFERTYLEAVQQLARNVE